ncbi:uncharacterized protein METZ01_LOCUS80073, partial [marine metagenome]
VLVAINSIFTSKFNKKGKFYSVVNEEPHEQDFVTFGLFILKPEPIRLS